MEKKLLVGNVCFVIDEKNEKILLLTRGKEPFCGACVGVGGKTDFCEDINASCVREVFEETGLKIEKAHLRGVVKTVLDSKNYSWILFVYTATEFEGDVIECNEGELEWVGFDEIYSKNLLGMIRTILPIILKKDGFLEGTIMHDSEGNVLEKKLVIV